MGKHSSGGNSGSNPDDMGSRAGRGRRSGSDRARIPAERVLTSENNAPLQDAPRRAGLESAPARLRAERDRRRKRAGRIALVVVGVVVLLAIFAVGGLFAYAKHVQDNVGFKILADKEKLAPELATAKPGEPFNILLLGADFRKGDTAYRTDTMIVARIDPQQKKVWMISIPRDTRVLIPGHGYQKINAAHAFGGPALTVKTVKQFTGLPIDHYMEVNFLGFENAVNAMGGVWVNVPVAINDKQAASQSVHQRAAKISAGYQRLDGEHALTFTRSRESYADQDIGRMKAQQIFFKAVADQLAKSTDIPKLVRVVNAITPYIQTDMSLMDLMKTALAMKGGGSKNMYTATLVGPWKSPYIWTDQAKMDEIISKFKAGEPFEKVAVQAKTASSSTASGTVATTKKPSLIKVTVRNGTGKSGLGGQASSILKAKGYRVMSVGNTAQPVYKQTLVIYKKDAAAAAQVAAEFAPGTKVVQSRGLYSSPTEILVVVGSDWDISKIPAASVTTQ